MRRIVVQRLLAGLFASVLFTAGTAALMSQTPTAPAPVRAQFFAGIVTGLSTGKITVRRSNVGRQPEQRQFVITAATKMSRLIGVRSKVTVRYRHLPQGDVALEIRVHLQNKPPRPS